MTDVKLLLLHRNTWNHITLCKQMINRTQNYSDEMEILETIQLCVKGMSSGSFKKLIDKMFLQTIYLIHMYKQDLVLNNQQRWYQL